MPSSPDSPRVLESSDVLESLRTSKAEPDTRGVSDDAHGALAILRNPAAPI